MEKRELTNFENGFTAATGATVSTCAGPIAVATVKSFIAPDDTARERYSRKVSGEDM